MIEVEARSDVLGEDADALVPVVKAVCGRLGLARATVGLLIVGADEMARINAEHRGKDGPTDVLSFPIDGLEARGDWPDDGPPPELGDIVICPSAAHDPLATLAIHGLLHLLGYDHETDGGEMLALQDEIVAEIAA